MATYTGTGNDDDLEPYAYDEDGQEVPANDSMVGLGGDDFLYGGDFGLDTLVGGTGNDYYRIAGASADAVIEDADAGNDTIRIEYPSLTSFTAPANVEVVAFWSGLQAVSVTGNGLDNTLSAASGNDTLSGLAGNDSLYGGSGADSMIGGTGNDFYTVDNAGDVVSETSTDPDERDMVEAEGSVATWTLSANVEDFIRHSTSAVNATGNELANSLTGHEGNDTLSGLDGDDTLDGASGADSMAGGTGGDVYHVNSAGDVISETSTAATEFDTVHSTVSAWTLGANIEEFIQDSGQVNASGNGRVNIMFGATLDDTLNGLDGGDGLNGAEGDDSLSGGTGDDLIYGATGNDTLMGGSGSDSLVGGTGTNWMDGGTGADTFAVDSPSDVVVDEGTGVDLVLSSVNYKIKDADVEKLTLIGFAVAGTGNTAANVITGNGAGNQLGGLAGADSLVGNGGADELHGGAGNDKLTGGAAADKFVLDSALGSTNVDRIADFVHGTDKVWLDDDIFKALGTVSKATALASAKFVLGTSAKDSGDRIIYDKGTGNLYYDSDGTGKAAKILVATLTNKPVLSASDFDVVT